MSKGSDARRALLTVDINSHPTIRISSLRRLELNTAFFLLIAVSILIATPTHAQCERHIYNKSDFTWEIEINWWDRIAKYDDSRKSSYKFSLTPGNGVAYLRENTAGNIVFSEHSTGFSVEYRMADTSGLNCEDIRHSGNTHPIVLNDPAAGDVVLLDPPLSPVETFIREVVGLYKRDPKSGGVLNPWHTGVIERSGSDLQWSNSAGRNWHLTPHPEQERLSTGTDNPYYGSGQPANREFNLVRNNRGGFAGFWFNNELYTKIH